MLSGTTDVRPWLAVAVLAAAGIGTPVLGPAARAASAADSPPTTTPAPEAPPVTTTPAPIPTPDKAPVPAAKPKSKPKPKPAAPHVSTPSSSRAVAPRIVPAQPVRPVVTRPAATQSVQPSAGAKATQHARKVKAQATAKAKARARAKAEAAAAVSLPRQPREPLAVTGHPPALPFAPAADSRDGLRIVTLVLASVGVALLALAVLGAPAMEVVAARHLGAATALYERRTEIAVAGISLLVGLTILAALARWMT